MSDWSSSQAVPALSLLGLITTVLLALPSIKRQFFDPLWTYTILGLLAPLGLLDQTQSPSLLGLVALLALTGTCIHFHLAGKDHEPPPFPLHRILVGIHLGSAVVLLMTSITLSNLHPWTRMLLPLLIPITGTLVANRTKSLTHSGIPFLAYLAIPLIIVWNGLPLFLAFTMSLAHLLLVKTKHLLPDRKLMDPVLFLLTLFFWGTSLISGLDHPAILLTWTSVAILFLAPWQGKSSPRSPPFLSS